MATSLSVKNTLGYPGQFAFQNLKMDGQRRSDPYALLIDDDLEKRGRNINALFSEDRRVITAHYIWPGSVKAKLDRLATSRTRYYDMLDCGHKQLSYWMGEGYSAPENYFVRTPCATVRTEPQ